MRSTKPVRVEIATLEDAEKIAGKSYGALSRYVTEAVAEKNVRTKPNSARVNLDKARLRIKEIDRKANIEMDQTCLCQPSCYNDDNHNSLCYPGFVC